MKRELVPRGWYPPGESRETNARDRSVAATVHDCAGFFLDGQFVATYDALDYMAAQGFTVEEARAYLQRLPKGHR